MRLLSNYLLTYTLKVPHDPEKCISYLDWSFSSPSVLYHFCYLYTPNLQAHLILRILTFTFCIYLFFKNMSIALKIGITVLCAFQQAYVEPCHGSAIVLEAVKTQRQTKEMPGDSPTLPSSARWFQLHLDFIIFA